MDVVISGLYLELLTTNLEIMSILEVRLVSGSISS